jgi:predicted helicase
METGGRYGGGLVLFVVPSIALLGQTLREWKTHCTKPVHAVCICSDSSVSKAVTKRRKGKAEDEGVQEADVTFESVTDLALPASTDVDGVLRQIGHAFRMQKLEGGNVVVFSTYQSIDVVSEVQKRLGDAKTGPKVFDIAICDEAHRTTGVTFFDVDESAYVKVHDNSFIASAKRIYMTATPRIYSEVSKRKADEASAVICSMDDPATYGKEIYRIGFGEAVDLGLLSDYKVVVLTIQDQQITPELRKRIEDISTRDKPIEIEDAAKILGCINALSKRVIGGDEDLFDLGAGAS